VRLKMCGVEKSLLARGVTSPSSAQFFMAVEMPLQAQGGHRSGYFASLYTRTFDCFCCPLLHIRRRRWCTCSRLQATIVRPGVALGVAHNSRALCSFLPQQHGTTLVNDVAQPCIPDAVHRRFDIRRVSGAYLTRETARESAEDQGMTTSSLAAHKS
jgi:hypothetical protein